MKNSDKQPYVLYQIGPEFHANFVVATRGSYDTVVGSNCLCVKQQKLRVKVASELKYILFECYCLTPQFIISTHHNTSKQASISQVPLHFHLPFSFFLSPTFYLCL